MPADHRSCSPGQELARPAVEVAPALLNARLTAGGVTVRLTEVEAYAGESDPGSHAFRGRTPRTAVMFGPAGRAYVYFSYGMHWCLNVVTGPDGQAGAVLLRAGEVADGCDAARERRPGASDRDLCRGPARLCRALGITGDQDSTDLLDPTSPVRLLLPPSPVEAGLVRSGPRVGVAGAGALTPWRFWLADEPSVSVYRPAVARRRTIVS
ncbi:MAG: DNA-3-methyladenine glycosylase [Actinobacteria bacterium]|nr:DNA-3-methyladenine glycosylase [Actinomycetota bacterium]MBW3648867.1 DNA-3-methyladenine glycosylase [Actinomycetota bacterium]